MSYERPFSNYNRIAMRAAGFFVGGVLLAGCNAETPNDTPVSISETAPATTSAAPTTAPTKSVHEGLGLCELLPDDFPSITGSPVCERDNPSMITGKVDAMSGDVHISAAAATFDDAQPCPVKEVGQEGVVCFDSSKWSIDAWSPTGEVVTLQPVVTGATPPSDRMAFHIGAEILHNLKAQS